MSFFGEAIAEYVEEHKVQVGLGLHNRNLGSDHMVAVTPEELFSARTRDITPSKNIGYGGPRVEEWRVIGEYHDMKQASKVEFILVPEPCLVEYRFTVAHMAKKQLDLIRSIEEQVRHIYLWVRSGYFKSSDGTEKLIHTTRFSGTKLDGTLLDIATMLREQQS